MLAAEFTRFYSIYNSPIGEGLKSPNPCYRAEAEAAAESPHEESQAVKADNRIAEEINIRLSPGMSPTQRWCRFGDGSIRT